MHAAIVIAHPCEVSFTHALAHRVIDGLQSANHSVDVLDLYAIGFRTALSNEEREAYHSDQPVLDPMVAEHAALVKQVDTLIFVYPT